MFLFLCRFSYFWGGMTGLMFPIIETIMGSIVYNIVVYTLCPPTLTPSTKTSSCTFFICLNVPIAIPESRQEHRKAF